MLNHLPLPDRAPQLNILIIDDQEFDRKMICNRLKESLPYPAKITEAGNASDAVQFVSSASTPFDCILMDMNLPDMHAVDLTTMLLSLKPELCIVIITVEADMDKALKCLKSGAEDFLIKGEYSNEGLYRSIRYAMERRKTSIENLQLHQELKHERELSTMQKEFIHLVSHEFRTPISIISSAIQLLTMKFPEIQEGAGAAQVKKIDNALKRLVALLETVLRLNMLDEGKSVFTATEFDVRELMVEVLSEFDAPRIIAPDLKFPILFYGDRTMLGYALRNVISNALKYSAAEAKVKIDVTEEKDFLELKVTDSGIGMSKQTIDKLGEKFFRDQSTSHIEGTGLGMHLVKRFIAHHGGEVIVESEQGKGTTVILHVPRSIRL